MFVHRVTTQTYLKRWQLEQTRIGEAEGADKERRGEEGEQRRRGEFHRSCRHCRPCTSAAAAFLTICILLQLRSLLDSCESAIFLQVESAFWVDCCSNAGPALHCIANPGHPLQLLPLHLHHVQPFYFSHFLHFSNFLKSPCIPSTFCLYTRNFVPQVK